MAPLELTDEALERIEALAGGDVATAALESLPAEQREAVQARILDVIGGEDLARGSR